MCDLHTLLLWKRLIQPIEYLVVWRGKGLSLKSAYLWNPFNDNIVKKLVVWAFVVDYYLTTNDYHILPHFALFCVVCHIMQKLCDFWKVRKTLQNTANHGILGGKILWLEFFSCATAKVMTDEQNFAHRGKVRQNMASHIPFVYVSRD